MNAASHDAAPLEMHPIAVIGAGWAGLTCALRLTAAGLPVTLFEAAKQVGGRARSVERDGWRTDNGQHLLTGACTSVLKLLDELDISESAVIDRRPLRLQMLDRAGDTALQLQAPRLPAPLNLITALLSSEGINWRERCSLAIALQKLLSAPSSAETTVEQWLTSEHQSTRLRYGFWRPLCRAVLNTPAERACLQHFAAVLRESFSSPRTNSDFLIPKTGLTDLLPAPALRALLNRGASIQLGKTIRSLNGDHIIDHGDVRHDVTAVVVATAPRSAARLLTTIKQPIAQATARQIQQLPSAAIATAYLRYSQPSRLPSPILGLLDGPGEWLFDHGNGELAVVASAVAADLDREQWLREVTAQLASLPGVHSDPIASRVLIDRQATFLCTPESTQLRPPPGHLCGNIHLAGDYTATGLPATLEGAVRSGVECALSVIRSHTGTPP